MNERATILDHSESHLRVLGSPGSGKTSLILERYVRLRERGRSPAILVYTRDARDRVIRALLPDEGAMLGRIPVYTHGQLAQQVLSSASPSRMRPLGDPEELVLLDRVLRATELSSDLANVAASQGFRRTLLDTIRVLLQSGVTEDDAHRQLSVARGRRTSDVLSLYAGYMHELRERGLSTHYDAAWLARQAVNEDAALNPLAAHDDLLVDDFQDVDPGQYALLCTLAPPTGRTLLSVFGDPTGARFSFRGTSDRYLLDNFVRDYEPTTLLLPASTAGAMAVAVGALTAELSGQPAPQAPGAAMDDLPLFQREADAGSAEVTCTLAEDETAEAQCVAAAVAVALENAKAAPSDIAVVVRDVSRYEMSLLRAFRDWGVPLDTGRHGQYLLDDFVDALLSLFSRYDDYVAEQVAASPLFGPLRSRYCEKLSLGERRASHDEDDLRAIVRFLRGGLADPKTGRFRMDRFLADCVDPAIETIGGAPEETLAATMRLSEDWTRYVEIVRAVGGDAVLGEFRSLYRNVSGASGVRDPDSVAVYSVHEIAGQSLPIVFVMGCAEGVFPALEARHGYIPHAELAKLFEDRGLRFAASRNRDERLRDEYRLMLTALTRARRELHLSAPGKFHGEELVAPSRVLEQGVARPEWVSRGRQSAPGASLAKLVAAAGSSPKLAQAAGDALDTTAFMWLSPRPAEARFQLDRFALSPSRLSTLANCERKFFYTRVLGIEEDHSIYLDVGNVVHRLLERITETHPTADKLRTLSGADIDEEIEAAIAGIDDPPAIESLLGRAMRQHLSVMVRQFIGIEGARSHVFESARRESMTEFDHGGVAFRGKIDRVDAVDGAGTVVIDYKTSGRMKKRARTVKEYLFSDKWSKRSSYLQVPMYSYGEAAMAESLPEFFCYYVFPPGEKAFVVGFHFSDVPDGHKEAELFRKSVSADFATLAPAELEALMGEISDLADGVFADRASFARTSDLSECGRCAFKRMCGRGDA